jgi:hypothetical protein
MSGLPKVNVTRRRADELVRGDMVVRRVGSVAFTATGYVSVWLDGHLETVPPDTEFTVIEEPA